MSKTRPPYAAAFRQQMVELVRSGRTPGDLAREFEPSAQAIRTAARRRTLEQGGLPTVLADSPLLAAPWGRIRRTIVAREAIVKLERVPRRTTRQADLVRRAHFRQVDSCRTRRAGNETGRGLVPGRAAGNRTVHDARTNGGDRAGRRSGARA